MMLFLLSSRVLRVSTVPPESPVSPELLWVQNMSYKYNPLDLNSVSFNDAQHISFKLNGVTQTSAGPFINDTYHRFP